MKKSIFIIVLITVFISFSMQTLAGQKDNIQKKPYPDTKCFLIGSNIEGDTYEINLCELLAENNIGNNIKKFWVKMIPSKKSLKGYKLPTYEMQSLLRADCKNKTLDILGYVSYDKKGKVLDKEFFSEWEVKRMPIVPGSVGKKILDIACLPPEAIKEKIERMQSEE